MTEDGQADHLKNRIELRIGEVPHEPKNSRAQNFTQRDHKRGIVEYEYHSHLNHTYDYFAEGKLF